MDKISSIREYILNNKKKVIPAAILVVILSSIPIGLYLIKNPQIFKSRASEVREIAEVNNFGKAIKLDGKTGYVLIEYSDPASFVPDTTRDFTIEAYIRVASFDELFSGDGVIYIRGPGILENANFSFSLTKWWGDGPDWRSFKAYPAFDIERPGYTGTGFSFAIVGKTPIEQGKIYHVAVVRQGFSFKLFVNGKLDAEKQLPAWSPIINSGNKVFIGTDIVDWELTPGTPKMNGIIDEVRVSNNARYTTDFVVPRDSFTPDSNTIGLWHFDDNVLDMSGKNGNGQLIGNSQFVDSIFPGIAFTPPPSPSPSSQGSQTIGLRLGWNAIGLLVDKGSNYKSEDLIKELNESVGEKVVTQVARFYAGNWEAHYEGRGLDQDFKINVGDGYMVKADKDKTVTLGGESAGNYSIKVNKGYSFISFPKPVEGVSKSSDLARWLNNQGLQITDISRYVNGSWQSYRQGDFNIFLGVGYMIKNDTEPKTVNFPAVAPASTAVPDVNTKTSNTNSAKDSSCSPCSADLNGDKIVNSSDENILKSCYNKKSTDPGWDTCIKADIDKDNKVFGTDFICLRSQFSKKCP